MLRILEKRTNDCNRCSKTNTETYYCEVEPNDDRGARFLSVCGSCLFPLVDGVLAGTDEGKRTS